MLGKLLKYDIKDSFKTLFPLYMVTICFGLISRIISSIATKIALISHLETFVNIIFVIFLMGTLFYTIIISIQKFYKDIFKDEGYLTNTLPVKKSSIVASKIISSTIFMIVSVVIILLSLAIAFYSKGMLSNITGTIDLVSIQLNMPVYVIYTVFPTLLIASYVLNIMMIFLAIAMGNTFSKDKIAYSFISYIIVYTVYQGISMGVLLLLYLIDPTLINYLNEGIPAKQIITELLTCSGVISLVSIATGYLSTVYILNKKLNLE